jgi:transposase
MIAQIAQIARALCQSKRSVGDIHALDEAKRDLQRLLDEYERIVDILEQMEKDILELLNEIPMAKQFRSIKGLGPIFIAAILSGAGDLRQYVHGRQLLRKAGLNLAESKSGKRIGQIVLSKRGDATLRKYMYLATLTLIGRNPIFGQLHENNLKVKHMTKRQGWVKRSRRFLYSRMPKIVSTC